LIQTKRRGSDYLKTRFENHPPGLLPNEIEKHKRKSSPKLKKNRKEKRFKIFLMPIKIHVVVVVVVPGHKKELFSVETISGREIYYHHHCYMYINIMLCICSAGLGRQ
jgi:hypothetical protein